MVATPLFPSALLAPRSISFVVYGEAQPAGSKRAFLIGGRPRVTDANPKSRKWKDRVAQVAGAMMRDGVLLDGPLRARFYFYAPRPRWHYGTGRNAGILKGSAPAFPTGKPDALKLARGCEDALSKVVYRDDAQIVHETIFKAYGEPARAEIAIEEMRAPPS